MATQAAIPTTYRTIPVPGENSDPFYDQFRAFANQLDIELHYRQVMSNIIPGGGGTIGWNSGSGVMTWTDDFILPVFHWGFSIQAVYGPDGATRAAGLASGQALMVELPASMNGNVTKNFSLISQLTVTATNQYIVAWNNGGVLIVRQIGSFT